MFHDGRKDLKTKQLNGCSDPDFVKNADITDIGSMDANTEDSEVNVEDLAAQKPHFLDYDALPPSDLEESFCGAPSAQKLYGIKKPNEKPQLDKKYERDGDRDGEGDGDGETSDIDLATNGYTKKEFTQDDNTLHLDSGLRASLERPNIRKNVFSKPKHFLDENPIPPDYMVTHVLREHRSLDRNFERQQQQNGVLSGSQMSSMLGERNNSLDRGGNFVTSSEIRLSRERIKTQVPSYALSRFLSSPCPSVPQVGLSKSALLPKGTAWTTDHMENGFDGTHCNELDIDSSYEPKVECVYSLLSMLGSNDPLDMSKKFLELSRTTETCATLRRSGCIPLLVQMMHSADAEDNVRKCASLALHNVVHSNPDERAGRREAKVLRHLEQITEYCNFLKTLLQSGGEAIADDTDRHPLAAISSLMKVSFDEEHRHAMCEFGALHTIPNLVHLDHAAHGPNNPEKIINESKNNDTIESGYNLEQGCSSLRRYALMALTNLTFGDEKNKAHLCSQKSFMEALVAQLESAPDDLLQVTASVLRNLSWRADSNMKAVLNEIGTVTALARAAMKNKNENTLKAILSALWNLSAHCSTNKAEFCAVDGALAFLVDMLTYEGPSKTLKIIENAGGILRNVSSHIAVRENYRQILRQRNCLAILLQQLKSESLTVVSNSCGTLWNLSARCPEDQKFLWDNGAVPMLRSLIHSKHAMISEGSSSALKNLLNFRPTAHSHIHLDPIARSMGLKKLPTLNARKQRALEQELGAKVHSETCENLDAMVNVGTDENSSKESDDNATFEEQVNHRRHPLSAPPSTNTGTLRMSRSTMLTKSESRDSIFSAKSDSAYENIIRSHSASDTSRIKLQPKLTNYNAQRMVYALKKNVDSNDDVEQPIDYSIKYNETSISKPNNKINVKRSTSVAKGTATKVAAATGNSDIFSTYQETDLDQPTDFSLRYPENQIESEKDVLAGAKTIVSSRTDDSNPTMTAEKSTTANVPNNEVLLILEDTVKCYQTEDTPNVISNAASITDLRQSVRFEGPIKTAYNDIPNKALPQQHEIVVENCKSANDGNHNINTNLTSTFPSGSYTPEKPINYCEEGTPGYFSRYDSLSSLDESPAGNNQGFGNPIKIENNRVERKTLKSKVSYKPEVNVSPTTALRKIEDDTVSNRGATVSSNLNSAQETPLMFSRHSSMDSLIEEDDDAAQLCDDKSSVVSDFSRLASGIISPSEIPDSPTQSMPQSPRRNSDTACGHPTFPNTSESVSPINPRSNRITGLHITNSTERRPLRSVFEDDLNMFHVENTPAQFSCATSLSNLSIADDPGPSPANVLLNEESRLTNPEEETITEIENISLQGNNAISEGEEDSTANNDDILLANCINMGMHRSSACNMVKGPFKKNTQPKQSKDNQTTYNEDTKQYCTEDTPALLSKVGSNTNLSAISICSSNTNLEKDEYHHLLKNTEGSKSENGNQRCSLNLSDDVSSNASESGVGLNQSMDILQQCIRDGMKKKPSNPHINSSDTVSVKDNCDANLSSLHQDPIAMMRRGGSALPRYLPVVDEMYKYLVEDSPCNFSVVSGLSNLTVGSSLVGPAIQLDGNERAKNEKSSAERKANDAVPKREEQWQDDSLSSLSIESEDDTNLLSQAIAAGCNRPKSNLGFSSTSLSISNKRSNSLSAIQSQPIPIKNGTTSASLHLNKKQQSDRHLYDSDSDSNDNQSKSLLELCILTGMHKTKENKIHISNTRSMQNTNHHHNHNFRCQTPSTGNASTQSNPNLKRSKHSPKRQLRDRERKDEKLLLECINTGISKKISGSGSGNSSVLKHTRDTRIDNSNTENRSLGIVGSECAMLNRVQPKNVQATSAAAIDVEEVELIKVNTAITAASGVEMKFYHSSIVQQQPNQTQLKGIQDDTTENQESVLTDESPASVYEKTIDIGFNEEINSEMSKSINYTNSDDSNESFIIETTVSLLDQQNQPQRQTTSSSSIVNEKHKDPDLMLKSVERLTLEFVSSAEQLLTQSSFENTQREKRHDSISIGGGTSNNTWNEDTHPNDVSFPSVSVTAPIIDSLTCDDDANDDEELATQADHKELHDFAEITPINEEQPQPSLLCLIDDEVDMYAGSITPQLNSLDTETLVNGISLANPANEIKNEKQNVDMTESNSINFKLGGAVQTAAATMTGTGRQFSLSHLASHGPLLLSMTNSTLIANEARTLAENLLKLNNQEDEELAFSINSLDLDNIRPPSGMESLNVSGYYHEPSPNVSQLNLLQKHTPCSPKLPTKSPKFPRKALPPGLVARRALGHFTGSTESVNSSFNLLDIKPPSLMDELLDSMISVSSIQSEIVDCCEDMATTVSASNYETATGADPHGGNDFDDNTITLHSCCEILPCDDERNNQNEEENDSTFNSGGTPLATDNENYSSAESTPQKSLQGTSSKRNDKRSITPKMRRKLTKERYKTYTIAAKNEQSSLPNAPELDETLQIEIFETENCEHNSARRRRSGDDRYKTQTIVYPAVQNRTMATAIENAKATETQLCIRETAHNSLTSTDDCLSDDMSSIRAMTKQFTHITETHIRNNIEMPIGDDYNSTECEQNSETESCHEEAVKISKQSTPMMEPVEDAQQHLVKALRGRKKAAYISPYSMQYQRSNTAPVTRVATNRSSNGNTFLLKRNTNSSTPSINTNSAPKKKSVTNEQPQSSTYPALERQGTFVKDEPTLARSDMPVVEPLPPNPNPQSPKSTNSSNQSSPKRCISKLPTKRAGGAANSPQMRTNVSRVSAVRKMPLPNQPKRSNSNTNIRVSVALSTRISATTPPSRSNSILNTNENSASNKTNQTQSRIASIWKRPNDAKSANSSFKQQSTKTATTTSKTVIQKPTSSNTTTSTAMLLKSHNRSTHVTSTKLAVHRNLTNSSTRNTNSILRK